MVSGVIRGVGFGLSAARALTDALVVRPAEMVLARAALVVLGRALASPYVEIMTADLVRHRVIERVADELLTGDALERVLDRVETAGGAQRVADRPLGDGTEEVGAVQLDPGADIGPNMGKALESRAGPGRPGRAPESPGVERLL